MKINPKELPEAIGAYSYSCTTQNMVYTSGILPLCKDGSMSEIIQEQVKQAFENLSVVLRNSGSNLNAVVKTTVYMTNLEDFAIMNEIYASYFGSNRPARSCIEVSKLPKGAQIEIEAVAQITFSH